MIIRTLVRTLKFRGPRKNAISTTCHRLFKSVSTSRVVVLILIIICVVLYNKIDLILWQNNTLRYVKKILFFRKSSTKITIIPVEGRWYCVEMYIICTLYFIREDVVVPPRIVIDARWFQSVIVSDLLFLKFVRVCLFFFHVFWRVRFSSILANPIKVPNLYADDIPTRDERIVLFATCWVFKTV